MAADKHKIAALILGGGKPDPAEEAKGDDEGLTAACEELLSAVDAKDAGELAKALKNAFAILESQPHEEGPDEGSEG